MEIQEIGSIMNSDARGYLINETNIKNIKGKWKEALDDVLKVYKKHVSDKLIALYIRGSVARGKAIEYVSDIDTMAIVDVSPEELEKLDLDWVSDERKSLDTKYPFQTGVEFYFLSKDDISFTDRFIIQTQSLRIYGEDIFENRNLIKFSKDTILKLIEENKIDVKIQNAQAIIEKTTDHSKIAKKFSWICKRFLRIGVLLAALKERKYTRDLYPSYVVFAAQYPEKESEMEMALMYSINPIQNKDQALEYIQKFGGWLVEEKNKILNT